MLFDTKKFEKEIDGLKSMPQSGGLHPLRQGQIKANVMSAIAAEAPSASGNLAAPAKHAGFLKYLGTVLIGLGLIGGSALASEGSVPGDLLYPVKIVKEKVEVKMAVTANAKASVEARHADERMNELVKLEIRQHGGKTEVKFEGRDDDSGFAGTATITSSFQVGTSTVSTSTSESQNRIKIRAKFDAREQVKKAVEALNKVKERLEESGKSKEAIEALEKNIRRLEERAETSGLNLEIQTENKTEINKDKSGGEPGRVKVKIENGFFQKIESQSTGSTSSRSVIKTQTNIKQESSVKVESSHREIRIESNTNSQNNSSDNNPDN